MVEKNIGQRSLSSRCVKRCEVDTSVSEGLVCWSKHGEWSWSLERFKQFCLNHTSNERIVNAGALRCAGNIVWSIGRRENLIDNVNQTVACHDIGHGHIGVVNHHSVSNGKGQRLAVCCISRHAFRDCGCWNLRGDNVIEKDVGEGFLSCWVVKRSQIYARISKGLVRWCEQGEGPGSLKGCQQVCLNDCCNERIVNACCLGGCWNVNRWDEHGVDDVNDTIRGLNVCGCHSCSTNGNGSRTDAKLDVVSVHHCGEHAVCQIAGINGARVDVMKKNVREGCVFFWCVKVLQVNACICKGLVGWGEDSEWPCSL